MFERWDYEVPKNTSEENLLRQEIEISLGVITSVQIGFPAGCGGYDWATNTSLYLARSRLKWKETTIVPRSPAQFLAADDFVIHMEPVAFPLLTGDPTLSWELWNLDDTYPHNLWLGINWLTKEELEKELDQLKEFNLSLVQLAAFFRTFFSYPGARV